MSPTFWTVTSWVLFALAFVWPALALVQQRRQVRRRRRGLCRECGYDLRGSVSDRCAECGFDIEQRLPLIRFRVAAAGLVLTLVFVSASHVANRVEAIKARGWIAAVPTTVLIPYVMHSNRQGRIGDSRAAGELAWYRATTPDVKTWVLPNGPELYMSRWQWKWLIDSCLRTELDFHWNQTLPQDVSDTVLVRALRYDLASVGQRDSILRKARVRIDTRPQWSVGSEMRIRFEVLSPGNDVSFLIRPVQSDRGLRSFSGTGGSGSLSIEWPDNAVLLGVADRPGPVEYKITARRWDDKSKQFIDILEETRALTTIISADTRVIEPVSIDPSIIAATPVTMTFHPFNTRRSHLGSCVVSLNLSKNPSLANALDQATFGIRVRLKRNGAMIGTDRVWTSTRALTCLGAPSIRDVLRVSFVVDRELFDVEDGPSPWSVEIEGDRDTALRDFKSTSYWAGKYEFTDIAVEGGDR